jgi:hypothetical protein
MRTDRLTDRHNEASSCFRNFAKEPKRDTLPKLTNKNLLTHSETKDVGVSHFTMDKISKHVARLHFWKACKIIHSY